MLRRSCEPMRPIWQTTRPGATGTVSSPCPQHPRWSGPILAAAGDGYAMPTLRRRVAAIARASGVAGHPLDTKHPAIREIAPRHWTQAWQSVAASSSHGHRPRSA